MFHKATLYLLSLSLLGGSVGVQGRPNIIIMQPDDLVHLDNWSPPPNTPNDPDASDPPPSNYGNGMYHIDSLRLNGVQMMQAYTASPWCGTSRFSTITGRMPSRAAYSRAADVNIGSSDPQVVTIPTTKLADVGGQNDCSEDNLARVFQNNDYRTGMFGKWHLSDITDADYTYSNAQGIVRGCGFDTVEGLYVENMGFSDGNATGEDENFFMYFNPTVPHSSGNVQDAITVFDCTDTADPNYGTEEPWIKGMTEDGCEAYRQSIVDRAAGNVEDLGKLWVDDAVGALLEALTEAGVLEDTMFIFQEDHGMDSKGALYEGGIRIPQFIHYPAEIAASTFSGLVSTIDVSATVLDYAGITPHYDMDGKSWREAIADPTLEAYWEDERCLFFEDEQDRAVRCGCFKYLDIFDRDGTTRTRGVEGDLARRLGGMLFDLCDGTTEYITDDDNNREVDRITNTDAQNFLVNALECHTANTHPDSAIDFSTCPEGALTPVPTVNPDTPAPTDAPDTDPTCTDSPYVGNNKDRDRTCDWVASSDRCGLSKFWSHCHSTCERCSSCRDSQLSFTYNSQLTSCGDVTQADCAVEGIAATCPRTCDSCW